MIQDIDSDSFAAWLEMAVELWPDTEREALEITFREEMLSNRHQHFIAMHDEMYVGFINLSLRSDYVEGSSTSPVAYIEGIYVKPDYRGRHIARLLVDAGIGWGKQQGCTQIASDTPLSNAESQQFHQHIGFEQADVIVHFIKNIDD